MLTLLLAVSMGAAPVTEVPQIEHPALYVDLLSATSLIPGGPKQVYMYYEHRVVGGLAVFTGVLGFLAQGVAVPGAGSTLDMTGVGLIIGPRFYFWQAGSGGGGFSQGAFAQASINFGPVRVAETLGGQTSETGPGAFIVSWWGMLGYKLAWGHFAGFIEAGVDHLLTRVTPSQGAFSDQLNAMFLLQGGVKPGGQIGIGYAF